MALKPLLIALCLASVTFAAEPDAGFESIFDGTLKQWEGDPTYWRAENGVLIANTNRLPFAITLVPREGLTQEQISKLRTGLMTELARQEGTPYLVKRDVLLRISSRLTPCTPPPCTPRCSRPHRRSCC